MNPYAMLASGLGTTEAAALGARLSVWHDVMVAHDRRLRAGTTTDGCDDDCPHAEARALWLRGGRDVRCTRSRAEFPAFAGRRAVTLRRGLRPGFD
jgi:hypothetical protein